MPMRAPRICGCGHIIAGGVACPCEERRTRERNARHDANRASARARGYDSKWETERKAFLALPVNEFCACGCGRKADMIDHVVPHRGDKRLFWSRSNWQPMASSPCHSRKKQAQERAVRP